LVKAPTYREFFLKRGTYSKVYRNEQSPQLDALYTTRPSEVNQINKYYEITGNMLTAIDMYVDNKYSNLN
jgi:threonyl-tRNA synthetase